MNYRFNRLALAELGDAAIEYEHERSGLGDRFLTEVEHSISQICDFPLSSPERRPGIRQKTMTSFPYSILYRVKSDHVRILAIAHEKRQPFYWLGRR